MNTYERNAPDPPPSNWHTTPLLGRFRYKSMALYYMVCVAWDGEYEGVENINVALPPELRQVPSKGTVSYTYAESLVERTASEDDEDDEEQFITPSFVVDDEIYAFYFESTGVEDCNWLYTNMDARVWAYDPDYEA